MGDSLISDIPSIQKVLKDAKNLKSLKASMPILRPFLRLLRVDVSAIDAELSKVDDLERMAIELASIPDHFNDLFASRGWIIYDLMNLEVATAAIQKAEAGDTDGAELDLVDYYNPETVRWQLTMMMGVRAFRPRMPLAEKALTDYCEERYHACVPGRTI